MNAPAPHLAVAHKSTLEVLDSRLAKAVSYIDAHYPDRITIEDLSRIAHLSARQLHRLFQEAFAMSIKAFIIHTRMQAASHHLVGSDKQVGTIAIECGFYDQSCFIKMFRMLHGTTPLKFRQSMRQLLRSRAAQLRAEPGF